MFEFVRNVGVDAGEKVPHIQLPARRSHSLQPKPTATPASAPAPAPAVHDGKMDDVWRAAIDPPVTMADTRRGWTA